MKSRAKSSWAGASGNALDMGQPLVLDFAPPAIIMARPDGPGLLSGVPELCSASA